MITHTFHQLSPRIWWLDPYAATDRPTLGVIVGQTGSLIVDGGASPAHIHALHAAITQHGLPAPHFAAITHWHWDHIFGLSALAVPTFASAETQRIVQILTALDWRDAALDERVATGHEIAFCWDMIRLELPDRADLTLRAPEIGFAQTLTVDLGDITCRLIHIGGDHSPDGIAIHVPSERVAFIGDALYHDLYHGPPRYTPAQLFPLLDQVQALDCDYYIAGHDDAPISREQFLAEASLLRHIGTLVQQHGDDRTTILAALDRPPTDDDREIVDAFLNGLRMPQATSPW